MSDTDIRSMLGTILDTDPIKAMVMGRKVRVRKPGGVVPEDPMEALGKGIISGLLHRAFCAGGRFSRSLGAEPTDEELSAAATEYIKRDEW